MDVVDTRTVCLSIGGSARARTRIYAEWLEKRNFMKVERFRVLVYKSLLPRTLRCSTNDFAVKQTVRSFAVCTRVHNDIKTLKRRTTKYTEWEKK